LISLNLLYARKRAKITTSAPYKILMVLKVYRINVTLITKLHQSVVFCVSGLLQLNDTLMLEKWISGG